MKRVLVIGCPCSGKSTFVRRLAKATGLPLVHLDRLYWLPNWTEAPKPEWHARLTEVLETAEWIIDGNYTSTLSRRLERADTVILLDFPRWLCLWRYAKRVVAGRGRSRPDMAEGCTEKVDLEFLAYIWGFRRERRPMLLGEMGKFGGRSTGLTSPVELEKFLLAEVQLRSE